MPWLIDFVSGRPIMNRKEMNDLDFPFKQFWNYHPRLVGLKLFSTIQWIKKNTQEKIGKRENDLSKAIKLLFNSDPPGFVGF